MQKFENLLKPGTIGKVTIRNRIVMPPMVRNYCTPDGLITKRFIDHYAARAKGGTGLIIVEATFVHPAGKLSIHQPGIHSDTCIQRLGDLASACKEWGCKIAIQIHHAGRQTSPAITGLPVVAPSAVPCPVTGGQPREMSTAEVGDVVEVFAQAARRAKVSGFDAVEMHGAHGYLLGQFLSARTNRRTDKYGGDIDGRMTILLEIVRRAKELVGNDFPITFRLNGRDNVEGGFTLEECGLVARKLETAGVSAIHVTTGTYETRLNPRISLFSTSMYEPRGHIVSDAAYIKSVVKIPVIAVGSITPERGDEIIKQGKADFIAMGRALLADPEVGNKLMRGEPESIRPCIRCREKCGNIPLGVKCSVNAEVGYESYRMALPLKQKKVLIAGGGPAGMEAARIAVMRGHDVTLYERNKALGGHLIEATVPSFKEDLKKYKEWLISQVEQSGVKIELGKELTPKIVREAKPDTLVVATGSTTLRPDILGIDKPNVASAIDLLLGKAKPGNSTVIVGGGAVGCEVALYLAKQGKRVIIVEMLHDVATDIPTVRNALVSQLIDNGVKIMVNSKVVEITESGVTAIDNAKNIVNVEADRVVLAVGLVPQQGLYEKLKGDVREVYLIGDCFEPHRVGDAVRDGYRIGATI